jgi:putative hydrolase of the HAD superfamily
MTLRGVIFDMGGTLLHYSAPDATWEDTEKLGARGIYHRLREAGYSLPPESEALDAAWDHVLALWSNLDAYDVSDLKLNVQVRLVVERWGVQNVPPELLETLGRAYMTAIQAHVVPLAGAADTLQALRKRGLRVGLVSNTYWPGIYHQHDIERFALTPYLEHTIFSADVGAWKPHRKIFKMGLEALDLTPDTAAYVGDSLYFDVWGAQQAGMRGVWIEQNHRWLPHGIEVTPDATIQRLPDLLNVVEAWQ